MAEFANLGAQKLRTYRTDRSWLLKDMSEFLEGVPIATIGGWERGKTPRNKHAMKLMKLGICTPTDFLLPAQPETRAGTAAEARCG